MSCLLVGKGGSKMEMDTQQALNIIDAIQTLAEACGEKPQEFLNTLCVFWGHRMPILNEAIQINNKFIKADIVERGKMMGIAIHKAEDGSYETEEIVLSEG